MRNKYVAKGKSIAWFTVSWDANSLSWEDFRGKVLGPTNPADAPATSVRGIIYNKWESLGLPAQPDTGDNGFGQQMLAAGITVDTIKAWSVDPQVKISADGKMGSLFDALEDMNAGDCLAKAQMLNGL